MKNLKYDVCRIFIASKGSYFYFIRNNDDDIYDSKGMDLSSLVYFLFFKLRTFRQNHAAYVRLLQKGVFDLRDKPYFNEDELIDLVNSCVLDENVLFKKRTEEIDLNQLNEFDELQSMSYISKFNPHRNYYNGYCSIQSHEQALMKMLLREMKVEKIMEKLLINLNKEKQGNDNETKSIEELIDLEDLNYLIEGSNGDLWCDLFLQTNLPESEKFRILYHSQPFKILENKTHLHNIEYVRFAFDGVKNNHQKMKSLFEKLPKEIQKNSSVLNFYEWHREKAE
jgi:hypothetical protein